MKAPRVARFLRRLAVRMDGVVIATSADRTVTIGATHMTPDEAQDHAEMVAALFRRAQSRPPTP